MQLEATKLKNSEPILDPSLDRGRITIGNIFANGKLPSLKPIIPDIEDRPGKIAVRGCGASGAIGLVGLIDLILEKHSRGEYLPPLQIDYFETGKPGRGIAYQASERGRQLAIKGYKASQKAKKMSPDPKNPNALVESRVAQRYAEENHLSEEELGESHLPRPHIGEFIGDEFLADKIKRLKNVGCNVSINARTVHITDVIYRSDDSIALYAGERLIDEYDSVIEATGYFSYDPFARYISKAGYLPDPFTANEFFVLNEKYLKDNSHGIMIIVGGGPTGSDVLRVSEAAGFQGTYVWVSRTISDLWPADTHTEESSKRFKEEFHFTHLNPEGLRADITVEELNHGLKLEIKKARSQGFSEGDVYYGIPLEEIEIRLREHENPALLPFIRAIMARRGAAVDPDTVKLISDLTKASRLRVLDGEGKPSLLSLGDKRMPNNVLEINLFRPNVDIPERILGNFLVNCGQTLQGTRVYDLREQFQSRLKALDTVAELTRFGRIQSLRRHLNNFVIVGPMAGPENTFISPYLGLESQREHTYQSAQKALLYTISRMHERSRNNSLQ